MEKNEKRLGYNLIWNSVGTVFYFGCQWLLTVFVVYFDGGYSDAGILSLAMSLTNVLGTIACLNLRTFQVSELDGKFSDGDFLVNRLLTCGVSLILCVLVVVWKEYSIHTSVCVMVFMIFKISEALADVLHGMEQKAWRLDMTGKSFALRGIAILVSIACGVPLGGNLILTICLMAVLSYLVIFLYDFRQGSRRLHINFSCRRENTIALIRIGVPLAAYSIFLNLILTFPRFQIEEQYGEGVLGIFASIATPTVLVTQLASFIFNPLMGIFAECRKEHDKKRLYKLLGICAGGIVLIGAAAAAAGNMLGEWALTLVFGESIRPYTYLLIPIIYTAILTALIWLLCGLLTVFKDYYMLAVLTCLSLLISMVSAPRLIAEGQLMGAVWALLLSLSVETLLLIGRLGYLLKREERTRGGVVR